MDLGPSPGIVIALAILRAVDPRPLAAEVKALRQRYSFWVGREWTIL